MDDVMKTIIDALEDKGISAAAASKMAVGNPSAIKNMLNARGDKRGPRYNYHTLQRIADVLDLELYFGPPRAGSAGSSAAWPALTMSQALEAAEGQGDLAESDLQKVEALRGGFLPIPYHRQSPTPGTASVAFHGSWLKALGIDIERLACLDVDLPADRTAPAGPALVLVDGAARQAGSATWAWRQTETNHELLTRAAPHQIRAGRITFEPRQLVLAEFTPDRAPFTSPVSNPHIKPIGRIIWIGRKTAI